MTSSSTSSSDARRASLSPLELLAEEFTRRVRAGEAVSIEEYAERQPELAAEIRSFFPTIETLERAASADDSAAGEEPQPKRIGEYDVVKEIGRGGMGVVLLAEQSSLGRRVALKLLPPQASLDRRFLERFRREARAAGRLQHPHIVQVYGVGEDQGLHFYAMQYIEGIALDRVIRALRRSAEAEGGHSDTVQWTARALMTRERVDASASEVEPDVYFQNAARIALHVAEGLAYAHGHGILHRDVKPANLLMDAKASVWIADFGLCRSADDAELSGSHDMVGTLRYMAPEQIQGRADARTDVYGLGVTLYEMLALRAPFEDESRARLMHRILEDSPPRPSRLRPGLPRDLEAIVLRAMAKLPEERYRSADALADDLRAYLEDRPVAARLPSAWYLARLALRRNKLIAGIVAAAVLVLLLVTGVYVVGLRAAREEQTQQLYIASLAGAESALRVNEMDIARRRLEAAPEELRGWEWRHFRSQIDESLRTLGRLETPVFSLAATSDGRLLAAGGRGRVLLLDAESGEHVWEVDGLSVYLPSLDIDGAGERLAVADSDDSVLLVSVAAGPESAVRRAMRANVHAVRFHPDGRTLAVGLGDASIRILDADLEREHMALTSSEGLVLCLAFTPDGRRLVAGSAEGPIRVWDLATRQSVRWTGHAGKVRSVAVSPGGRLVASAAEDATARIWDIETGALLHTLDAHTEQVEDVVFSADGRWLATCSADRTLRIWDPRTGRMLRTLRGPARGIRCLAFAVGSGRIVTGALDGSLREWDIRASGGRLVCHGHLGDLWALAFDSAGTRIASGGRDTTVRIWDARTGAQEHVLLGHEQGVRAVALSPDGKVVASGDRGGGLRLSSTTSGALLAELSPASAGVFDQTRAVSSLAFHPTAERLFVGRADGGIEVWGTGAAPSLAQRAVLDHPVHALEVDGSGELLAIGGGDGSVTLMEAEDLVLRERFELHSGAVNDVAFDPQSLRLASVSEDGSLVLLRTSTGRVERTVFVEDIEQALEVRSLEGVCFSPDGARLATGGRSSVVVLWDPDSGEELARINEHDQAVAAVAFGAEGRLASGGWNGELRIWDTTSAQERAVVDHPEDEAGSPGGLYELCRSLFLDREVPEREARRAFRLAAGLAHWDVQRADYVTARGASLYRCGRDAEALRELETALGMSQPMEVTPELALFLALTHARLGHLPEAKNYLVDGRERLSGPPDPRLTELLDEAEQALERARE